MEDALSGAQGYMYRDDTLTAKQVRDIVSLCLKSTYFSYGCTPYIQQHQDAMLSPIANIYMEVYSNRGHSLCAIGTLR